MSSLWNPDKRELPPYILTLGEGEMDTSEQSSCPPLQGRVEYSAYPDNAGGFWDKVGSVLAETGHMLREALPYVAKAASIYTSSLARSSHESGYSGKSGWDLPSRSGYRLQPMSGPIQPRPLPGYKSEPIARNALNKLEQQRTRRPAPAPDWARMQARNTQLMNEIAASQGLPSYEQFHRDNGVAYHVEPRQSSLGAERFVPPSSQSRGWIQEDAGQIDRHLAHAQKPVSWQEQARKRQTRQEAALKFAGNFTQQALDFLILDDLRTLQNPQAPVWAKGLALASFFPVGKVIKGGRLLAKVTGKSDDVLRYLANKGLNPQQIKKYKGFVSRRAKSREVHIYDLDGRGKVFQTAQPGNNPGSFTVYEQYLDNLGKTHIFGHRTVDPKGRFVHWKEKYPFDTLKLDKEQDYLKRIEQILKYNQVIK